MNARDLLAGAAIALCATGASAGAIHGRLLSSDHALAGATISALPLETGLDEARREARGDPRPAPLASTVSGPDGAFDLKVAADPKRSASFTVHVEAGGYVAVMLGGVYDPSDVDDVGEHVLPAGYTLTGRVLDEAGAPVAAAELTLSPHVDPLGDPDLTAAPRRVTTAADGTFKVDGASASRNDLLVEKSGMLGARVAQVSRGTLAKPIVLHRGIAVSGVARGLDGRPAVGAVVRLDGTGITGWVAARADGTFTIPNAPQGTVTAIGDAGDGGYVERRGIVLPLAPGSPLVLVLQPASTLTGRIVDAKTGRAVPRARIESHAFGMLRAGRSGPDGVYAIRNLPPGVWWVGVDEARYVPWTHADVRVAQGATKTLEVPLVAGASFAGRVVDEDGHPVSRAEGRLVAPPSPSPGRFLRRAAALLPPTFRTRPDGSFRADRLAPGGNRVLTVSHPAFQAATLGGLTLTAGAAKPAAAIVLKRGAMLTGTVKDQTTAPIAGAEVALSPPARTFAFGRGGGGGGGGANASIADQKTERTGAEGTFAIPGVAPGEYVLTVKRSGYATKGIAVVKVPATGIAPPVAVTLVPGASISGVVLHKSGSGVDGITVGALPSGARRGAAMSGAAADQPTTPDGGFTIDGLETGQSYDLELASTAGRSPGKRGVVAPAADVQLTAAGTGRITGIARDAATGHPISDFFVARVPDRGNGPMGGARGAGRGDAGASAGGASPPESVHDDGGAFVLDDVPAGTWSVVASAAGHQPGRVGGVVVEDGGSRDGVDVRLVEGNELKGRVVDAVTGAGVPNATLTVGPSGSSPMLGALFTQAADGDVTSDPDGRFELDGVGSGAQTVRVFHPDYTNAVQSFDMKESAAAVEIRMTAGGVLGGVVVSDTGQPVGGANVTLLEAGGGGFGFGGGAAGAGAGAGAGSGAMTDGTGRFRFDHIGAGRYTVNATLGGQAGAPQNIVLAAGDDQESLVIPLQAGVTILGTVTGVAEASASGVAITANAAGAYSQSAHAAADGSFEFDHVPVGVVSLRGTVSDASGSTRTATQQITTTADAPTASAQLVFEQGFMLSGHVSRGGQAAAGSTVVAATQGGGGRQASSVADDGGAYRLEGLQNGTYTVRATSGVPGSPSAKTQTVSIASDQTLDIDIPTASIAGRVVDAASKSSLPTASISISPADPSASPGGRRSASSDSDGRFTFTDLDPSSYTVTTSHPDYQVDTRVVSAGDANAEDAVIALTRAAGIALSVQDGLAGVPLHNVTIWVVGAGGAAVFGPSSIALDDGGQGEIPAVPPGSYTVFVSASGYAVVRLDGVNVPASTVPVSLTPGGTLLIQEGPKSAAAGRSNASIATESGQAAMLSIFNRQGQLVIAEPTTQMRNVAPGNYVLSVPSVEFSQTVTIAEAGTAVVQLP